MVSFVSKLKGYKIFLYSWWFSAVFSFNRETMVWSGNNFFCLHLKHVLFTAIKIFHKSTLCNELISTFNYFCAQNIQEIALLQNTSEFIYLFKEWLAITLYKPLNIYLQ